MRSWPPKNLHDLVQSSWTSLAAEGEQLAAALAAYRQAASRSRVAVQGLISVQEAMDAKPRGD
jgi:hypothetical protein